MKLKTWCRNFPLLRMVDRMKSLQIHPLLLGLVVQVRNICSSHKLCQLSSWKCIWRMKWNYAKLWMMSLWRMTNGTSSLTISMAKLLWFSIVGECTKYLGGIDRQHRKERVRPISIKNHTMRNQHIKIWCLRKGLDWCNHPQSIAKGKKIVILTLHIVWRVHSCILTPSLCKMFATRFEWDYSWMWLWTQLK